VRRQGESLPDGWSRVTFTAIRNFAGDSFGSQFDQFWYEARGIEVRVFRIEDIGPLGDLNIDGQVDAGDLLIVAEHYSTVGDLGVEDGDADQSGQVDLSDVGIVLDGIGQP